MARFSIVGTDRGIDILTLATTQRKKAAAGQPATLLDAAEIAPIDAHTFPNGCHMAEVEIDPETGVVELVRYSVCDDVGKTVNPLIVRGQVAGGVAQGFGQAVLEHTVYDPSSGQLLSGSFMDYALPRANEFPDIEVELLEIPCAVQSAGRQRRGRGRRRGQPAGGDQRHHRRLERRRRDPYRHAGNPGAGVARHGTGEGGVAGCSFC